MKNLLTRAGGGGGGGLNLCKDAGLGLENFISASKYSHSKSILDAGDTPPCHCEECVSTTSQSYDLVNPRQSQTRIKTCHSETPKAGSESVISLSSKQTLMSNDDRLTRFGQPQRFALSQVQGDERSLESTTNATDTLSCHCEPERSEGVAILCYRKVAFTLAEVLITLGIIGVVAALTIPTLISNNNKRIVETRLAKFYSNINNAIELSEVDNGPKEKWDELNDGYLKDENGDDDENTSVVTAWFDVYFKPYLIYTKEATWLGRSVLYFPDGSLIWFSGSSWYFFPKAKDFEDTIVAKGANLSTKTIVGTKAFTFKFKPSWSADPNKPYYYKKGVEPYCNSSCLENNDSSLLNDTSVGCNVNSTNESALCTALIRRNGWKIPDDYPFKF